MSNAFPVLAESNALCADNGKENDKNAKRRVGRRLQLDKRLD